MSEDRVEARLSVGGLAYFLQEGRPNRGRSAFYLGPELCKDGVHRHLTFVFNVEDEVVDDIHLTNVKDAETWKKWKLSPDRVMDDITNWVRENSEPVGA